jgi:hypothetical protein
MFAPARADVAQLVEQRFRKPQVTGSNPVVGSTLARTNVETNGIKHSLGGNGSFQPSKFFVVSYGLAGIRLRFVGVR